ncbi:MAG: hypothetical protein B2I18_05760 [Cuniculiplasma sp. C_DKE]|jgi:hypothetical protein|nr:MAG: hypothetical protein B2I18_05760 [Cuniculiplasma sp. C_DKE]
MNEAWINNIIQNKKWQLHSLLTSLSEFLDNICLLSMDFLLNSNIIFWITIWKLFHTVIPERYESMILRKKPDVPS